MSQARGAVRRLQINIFDQPEINTPQTLGELDPWWELEFWNTQISSTFTRLQHTMRLTGAWVRFDRLFMGQTKVILGGQVFERVLAVTSAIGA